MLIELEAKVRLKDKDKVLEKLKSSYTFIGESIKKDLYFSDNFGSCPLFRLRDENGKFTITQKDHFIKDGIERNKEIEFGVDNDKGFIKFIEKLGYIKFISKIKNSLLFKKGDFNLELCEVGDLGWFLEIETISCESKLKEKESELLSIFGKFSYRQEDFEKKRYIDLININILQNNKKLQ